MTDYTIVGGGVVGLSISWGLLRRGKTVRVLDGDDGSFRASRGNFGLVWVQGKGLNEPAYARLSQHSAALWPEFASELGDNTGTHLALEQNGGYDFFFDEEELEQEVAAYDVLKGALGGDYPFEVLGNNALRREEPHAGPDVAGAILHHQDGHVNPLRLLQALASDVRRMGGDVRTGVQVSGLAKPDGFEVTDTDGATYRSQKLVLAAGLGAATLGPQLGFLAPVKPTGGHVLITEKLPKMMNRPSGIIRQVNEGGVQIGASKDNSGFDDRVSLLTAATLAAQAVQVYPELADAQIVRSWAALRIMSPDGLPIYQQSEQFNGAYLVTCHSGITLAAAHAMLLPDWLEGTDAAPDLEVFSERRFAL